MNGLPPAFRGTTYLNHDLDVQVAKLFPEANQFIEKPISQGPVEEVEKVEEALRSGGLTSIGYMLRYLKGEPAISPFFAFIRRLHLTWRSCD